MARVWAAAVTLALLSPGSAPGAENRPRIGLVLEGGGALGFAHLGVLEWLEKHHIPIDYIAGTSMGALVGGMYASSPIRPASSLDFVTAFLSPAV